MNNALQYIDWKPIPDRTGVSGIPIKVVIGEHVPIGYMPLPPGYQNPPHQHPSEQVGIVVAGEIEYHVEGTVITCRTGDSYIIPPGKLHSVKVISDEPALLFECFTPKREEYR